MTFFKRNWGLTLFVIAVLGINGYFLYLSQQPPQLSGAPAPPVPKTSEPPAQPKPAVGDTSQGGHWHGDEWHADPHDTPAPAQMETPQSAKMDDSSLKAADVNNFDDKLFHELTPEARAKLWEAAYRENMGGASPPPGSLKAAEEELQRIIKSMDEPRVHIRTITGFAPNRAQLARYLALQEQLRDARSRGVLTEADRILSEIEAVEVEAQGDVPQVIVSWTGKKARSKVAQVRKKATEQAYRDFGLEHLLEAGMSGLPRLKPTSR